MNENKDGVILKDDGRLILTRWLVLFLVLRLVRRRGQVHMSRELKCRYDLRHSSSVNGPLGQEQPTKVILQCVVQERNDLLLE